MNHIFECIDAHTAGNPVRVVKKGGPKLFGSNMSEKRLHFLKEFDWIRRGLMFEPRGHDIMSGSIVYPPINPKNDASILFIETSGCLPMCGHGCIGTITVMLEHGLVTPKNTGRLSLEVPGGVIQAQYKIKNGKIDWVKIINVPSFLAAVSKEVYVDGLGKIVVDVAYGGNFYAIIDPQENFQDLRDFKVSDLIYYSPLIRRKLNELYIFKHPNDTTINTVSHILWTGAPSVKEATARNAVFYGEKAIDRSPCGTGTSARMAQWYAKGKLAIGEPFVHESIISSLFTGVVEREISIGSIKAIIPSITGRAKIIGINTIFINEEDPYKEGFQVL